MKQLLPALVLIVLSAAPALAMSDHDLQAALEQRFTGDRTGACVAAAMIDGGTTATAYACADPASPRPYDDHTAFEIGSVTKTMTAALLAESIQRGELSLNDPIAALLPPGTSAPSFDGRQITIGDIVMHTSGLPSYPWHAADGKNPYAGLTDGDLYGALAETKLTRAPGSQWEYSNFAMMLMSAGLARRSGEDFETLLRERLLDPLGMHDTYVSHRPPEVRVAQGHLPNTMPQGPWDFAADMAGVGGVRATLPDMVKYLEGEMGTRPSAIDPALALTQNFVRSVRGHTMAMNWFILTTYGGETILEHDGGTGGFSSLVAFDSVAKRGVVLLSDTALGSLNALSPLGLHLLDPSELAGGPRTVAPPDTRLLDALVGQYRLEKIGLKAELRRKGQALFVQAERQIEYELGYDSAGDFYPLRFDALLRPRRKADGSYAVTWFQGGVAFPAERLDPPASPADTWTPTAAQLKDYDGNYPLTPQVALRVFDDGSGLFAQGTDRPVRILAAVEKDIFVADAVGLELDFERDAGGSVTALTLRQSGFVLRGERR